MQEPTDATFTIVMAEGRRMMRLSRELAPQRFEALLREYQLVLCNVFERMGGRDVKAGSDTITAVFATATEAAAAAIAAQREVAAHRWPDGVRLAISVGLHSARADADATEGAAHHCSELCDAAEGGEVFVSEAAATMLEAEGLGALSLRDLGEQRTRRTERAVRAFELVGPH